MSWGGNNNSGTALAERDSGGEIATEIVNVSDNPSALEAITRAEVDVQIHTAKRYPRSIERFMREAKAMVSISPDLAAQCTYALPARRGGDGKAITGPSVRLAEIVAATWGNLRVVGRITDDDGKTITAQAVAMDLERNVGYQVEVRRGVTTKDGRRYSQDMISTTANAAIAIATRNATFKVIPRAFVNVIQDEARAVARGDVRTLPDRTNRALDWFAREGVDAKKVFDALGINGPADVTLDHLEKLQGFKTAVQDGAASIAEIFAEAEPEKAPAPAGGTRTEQAAAKLAGFDEAPTKGKKTREPGED